MDQVDNLRLQAFLLALAQLDVTLPKDLHQQVQIIGLELANHPADLNEADLVAKINTVLEQHSGLRQLYDQSYQQLIQHYSAQQSWTGSASSSVQLLIQNMAVPILTAEDFPAAARQVLKQAKPLTELPTSERVFSLSLQLAVETGEAKELAVLKALEKRPLTVKGLVHMVGLSLDQSWTIVQTLWQKGYIDRATNSIIHKVFPMLQNRQRTCRTIDTDTYLTLTATGYFHLHPVISLGLPKGKR
jgi:hypothetical protein